MANTKKRTLTEIDEIRKHARDEYEDQYGGR